MTGWYSRFIEDYSNIKIPLTNLLRKNSPFVWDQAADAAFKGLKMDLSKAPVLARPDFKQPFYLHTDASNYAIGAVLSQKIDGHEKPICFISRVLQKAEKNYTVTEKECLAVLWSVEKFRPYFARIRIYGNYRSCESTMAPPSQGPSR